MRFLINLIRFFKTEFGQKVKVALKELQNIVTDNLPNKPQLRIFGKKYGKEALFYGLVVGEEELIKLMNEKTKWSTQRKNNFKKSIAEIKNTTISWWRYGDSYVYCNYNLMES